MRPKSGILRENSGQGPEFETRIVTRFKRFTTN